MRIDKLLKTTRRWINCSGQLATRLRTAKENGILDFNPTEIKAIGMQIDVSNQLMRQLMEYIEVNKLDE